MPKPEGKALQLGNREFVVPELSIFIARRLNTDLLPKVDAARDALLNARAANAPDEEIVRLSHEYGDRVLDAALLLLSENYPDLEREELERCLRVRDLASLVQRLLAAASPELPAGEAASQQST